MTYYYLEEENTEENSTLQTMRLPGKVAASIIEDM